MVTAALAKDVFREWATPLMRWALGCSSNGVGQQQQWQSGEFNHLVVFVGVLVCISHAFATATINRDCDKQSAATADA
jgi:hypothetical protein